MSNDNYTVAVERDEVTHYAAISEDGDIQITQSIALTGSPEIAKDQIHQRINEFLMTGCEDAATWVVRAVTVHPRALLDQEKEGSDSE